MLYCMHFMKLHFDEESKKYSTGYYIRKMVSVVTTMGHILFTNHIPAKNASPGQYVQFYFRET